MPKVNNTVFYKKHKMPFKFSLNYIFSRNTSYYFIDDIDIREKYFHTKENNENEFKHK
jgi:hypothetical protein